MSSVSSSTKLLIILFVISGFICAYWTGYAVRSLTSSSLPTPTPSPHSSQLTITPTPSGRPGNSTAFIPGKQYHDDTVVAIAKTTNPKLVIASVSRNEQETGVYQSTRVSYFDGTKWTRKVEGENTESTAIYTNSEVRNWDIEYDSSRVLRQSANVNLQVENTAITVTTGTIKNEIPMRSLPGYTKFMSRADGQITINGVILPAYIVYTRIYSSNSAELLTYGENMGVTTDWGVYFDEDGSMYHFDKTSVRNPSPLYQSHSIGIQTTAIGVSTTFDVMVNRSLERVPIDYSVQFGSPINQTIQFKRLDEVDKASDSNTIWILGQIKGPTGIGLVEYIKE